MSDFIRIVSKKRLTLSGSKGPIEIDFWDDGTLYADCYSFFDAADTKKLYSAMKAFYEGTK